VLTMHPTLLIGPAEWHADEMPRDEFLARIAALWLGSAASTTGAIVYGDARHHAELAYLTNFTPKLEPALALIPKAGAPRLLVGGGVNMLPAARPLTWIEDLLPLRNVGKTIAQWAEACAPDGGRPVLIGAGAMSFALHCEIVESLGRDTPDVTLALRSLMQCKRPCELNAIRRACATLAASVAAIGQAQRAGATAASAALAGEHEAIRRGAQDVRMLFSIDRGRTFRPFDGVLMEATPADLLQVYVAVRDAGYWSEGFVVIGRPHPAADKACAALRSVIAGAKPGVTARVIGGAMAAAIRPYQVHPIAARSFGNAIGLALEEAPILSAESDIVLVPGSVHSLRIGISDNADQFAVVSAMISIGGEGCETLWSACRAGGSG
jgi:Xaa-Pro aminopeptidase